MLLGHQNFLLKLAAILIDDVINLVFAIFNGLLTVENLISNFIFDLCISFSHFDLHFLLVLLESVVFAFDD